MPQLSAFVPQVAIGKGVIDAPTLPKKQDRERGKQEIGLPHRIEHTCLPFSLDKRQFANPKREVSLIRMQPQCLRAKGFVCSNSDLRGQMPVRPGRLGLPGAVQRKIRGLDSHYMDDYPK
jgi:hypothetical protein